MTLRELPPFASGPDTDEAPTVGRVRCNWCGDSMYVQRGEVSKFCRCGHQGVKPKASCGCGDCVRERLAKRGIAVPVFLPAAAQSHCPTCTCHKKKGRKK